MKKHLIPLIIIVSMIFATCTNEYKCRCIDNNQWSVTKGSISGLDVIPANVVASSSESFRIVVDNSSNTWDNITIKLFDNNRTYLETSKGTDFMELNSSRVSIKIPTASLIHNDDPILGEVQYICNFFLGDSSIHLTGSIGVVSCEGFFEDFDADDCRWSCQIIQNNFANGHCLAECPF